MSKTTTGAPEKSSNRRGFMQLALGGMVIMLVLAACGSTATTSGSGPVTMGVLSCFTGTLASLGEAMLQGSQVAQKAINDA